MRTKIKNKPEKQKQPKKLLWNKNLVWSTSPGRHQRRKCHLNNILYLIYLRVQTMHHYSHIRTFYDVLLRCQTSIGYKSLGSLLFHPPTGNIIPTASQNIQNFINHMAWFRTTSVLMPVMSQLFLSQITKLSAENPGRKQRFHKSYRNLCQWLSMQMLIEVRRRTVPLKKVN